MIAIGIGELPAILPIDLISVLFDLAELFNTFNGLALHFARIAAVLIELHVGGNVMIVRNITLGTHDDGIERGRDDPDITPSSDVLAHDLKRLGANARHDSFIVELVHLRIGFFFGHAIER